jgi:trehalose 6-phosphate synthase/phosphatase
VGSKMAQQRPSQPGSLDPHSSSVHDIPVTPGIHLQTYKPETPGEEHPGNIGLDGSSGVAGYFSRVIRGGDGDGDDEVAGKDTAGAGTNVGADILRKMSGQAAQARGRRESLSEIRSLNPDLHLSGNVISATFNIPHSLKYCKGADWVS